MRLSWFGLSELAIPRMRKKNDKNRLNFLVNKNKELIVDFRKKEAKIPRGF